jgi:hypothetical protein
LAAGIRIFQRQVSVARLVDSAAVCLLLGVTFIQAGGSVQNVGYVMLLGIEALLVLAYGTLARLRVPFIGGVAGLVIAVLWMVAYAANMLNQWLVLGLLGMLMLLTGYRARIRNHGHSCFLCEIVIRSQFHTTYEPEA